MVISQSLESVRPGLWTWQAYDLDVRTDLFSTAVMADAGLVIIDPIRLVESGLEELARHRPVAAIILTNENHSRAAAWFRNRFAAPIFSHPEAVGALTVAVDGPRRPTRPVAGNLQVEELSGAAAGEIALLHPDGLMHLGDAVVNLESTGLALLPDKYCADPRSLRESLRALSLEGVEVVTFAHGPALVAEGGAKLRTLFGL